MLVHGSDLQLQLSVAFDYSECSTAESDATALFSVKSPSMPTTGARAPLRLVAVVDRSGSMAGEKLELVKKTLTFATSQLREQDELSIVTFDDKIDVLVPMKLMTNTNREDSLASIKNIRDGGSTNLSGGLLQGIEQLKTGTVANATSAVLLFTDGQANAGIKSADGICSALKAVMDSTSNAKIFTFGFGQDHDSNLLQQIAASGGCGNYVFLQTPDDIPMALVACLGGLLSVVLQNVRVTITPLNGCVVPEVITKFPVTQDAAGGQVVTIGDMYAESTKDVLFKVRLPKIELGSEVYEVFRCQAVAFNAQTLSMDDVAVVGATRRTQVDVQRQVLNAQISPHICRQIAVSALERAKTQAASSKLDEGRTELESAMAQIKIIQESQGSDCAADELLMDLADTQQNMVTRDRFERVGNRMASEAISSNAYQCGRMKVSSKRAAFASPAMFQMAAKYYEEND